MYLLYLHYLWLVAGTDREDFEQATASPEQLLIGIEPHDTYQVHWTTTGQDYQLRNSKQENKLTDIVQMTLCKLRPTHVHVHVHCILVHTYKTSYIHVHMYMYMYLSEPYGGNFVAKYRHKQ